MRVPERWMKQVNRLVEKNIFSNRSEALRALLKDGMEENEIW